MDMLIDRMKTADAPTFRPAAHAASDAIVSAVDVGVFYRDDQRALSGVDLDFHAGRVGALIGPSGCGKSTFLRCLNRMNSEIPHCRITGRIEYHGKDIASPQQDLFDLRRSIGMVFQQPNPFRMSIYDNIALALRCHGMGSRNELDEAVEESLRAAALWDEVKGKLRRSAYALSGGQQQRLCIARTLALHPDVVLMDEPCSALDPIATRAIEDTIRNMAQRGICIVIVTHNMQQAARVSDTTAFFYLGEMVEAGPTQQIFDAPSDKRLQDYISGRFG
jgi:phosphate transport system ATP-binding protein